MCNRPFTNMDSHYQTFVKSNDKQPLILSPWKFNAQRKASHNILKYVSNLIQHKISHVLGCAHFSSLTHALLLDLITLIQFNFIYLSA